MKMRLFPLFVAFILGSGLSQLRGQTSGPTPHQDPTGNGGALKAQVMTGGSYDARSGNGTRIVNDLRVPGALGDYGLDLTRYWNSLSPEVEPGYSGATPSSDFGGSGWTHSWAWKAEYGEEYPKELPGCDCDDNMYITSITVTFPDGQIIKYFITRLKHGENGIPGSSHHPWGPPYSPTEGWTTRGTVHDRIGDMALDGSEFWIYRADGGSVHFVGHSPQYAAGRTVWSYEAREVYDPHGFRTELQYEDWFLKRVLPDGGRSLTFDWGYSIGGGVAPVIRSVTSDAGTAAAQTVSYIYTITGNAVTLSEVVYPEGGKKATYIYGMDWGNPLATEINYFPLLKDADDPHFAGAMTRIHYDYTGIRCRPGGQPSSNDPNAHFLYFYAQPEAILEERISAAAPRVSRLSIECFTGVRKETNGLGAWRFFFYGASAGFGGNLGHQLAKLTDFSIQYPLDNVPYERQTHLNAKPYQVWDARGTETLLVHNDGSGSPSEIRHTGSDGSSIFYDRKDPNNLSQSEAQDSSRVRNPYSHWVFLQTDERGNTTFFTRDSRRRIKKVTYPGGTFEEYQYNHLNQITAHKLASGTVVYYFYDTLNRLVEEWNDAEGTGAAKKYFYDADPVPGQYHYPYNVWRMQDGRARAAQADYSVQMTYNRRHQVTKVEYPATQTAPTPPPISTPTPPLPVAMPQFNPDSGCYPGPVTVSITTATAGANIRYTLDGSTPTESHGTLIAATSGTVSVTSTVQDAVLKAIAFKSGWVTSGVKSATYSQPPAVPEFSPDSGVYPSPVTITITSGTAGANIRYTLDGSTPTESYGTLIAASSGTVAVDSSAQGAVLKAVAFKSGCVTSGIRSATYSQPQVAVPEFNPDSGVYPSPVTITITTGTAEANIRYTLDGSIPTESHGTLIAASSGTVAVTSTTQGAVLKAIAFKGGWIASGVSSATYSIPQVAAPVISPASGTYVGWFTVTITTATPEADIRFTMDGTTPTETHGTLISRESGEIAGTITAPKQVKAVAFKSGWATSAVASVTYSNGSQVANPVFSPNTGTYTGDQPIMVTITTATPDAWIRWTWDNETPTESHGYLIQASSGTVAVYSPNSITQLNAKAFKTNCYPSAVKFATYSRAKVATPVFDPPTTTSPTQPLPVTITTATEQANIRYTLNGYTPTATYGTLIAASSGTVSIPTTGAGTLLKAIAFKSGWTTSTMRSTQYSTQVNMPTFSPTSGKTPISVTIATTTAGASLRYTLDGSIPTDSHGTLIPASSGSVSVPSSYVSLKAVAFMSGYVTSPVKSSSFYSR